MQLDENNDRIVFVQLPKQRESNGGFSYFPSYKFKSLGRYALFASLLSAVRLLHYKLCVVMQFIFVGNWLFLCNFHSATCYPQGYPTSDVC